MLEPRQQKLADAVPQTDRYVQSVFKAESLGYSSYTNRNDIRLQINSIL